MKKLDDLRKNIDVLDRELILLLDKRMDLVKNIKEIKKIENLPILDEKREEKVKENIKKNSKYKDLLIPIFIKIMEISKNYQNEKN